MKSGRSCRRAGMSVGQGRGFPGAGDGCWEEWSSAVCAWVGLKPWAHVHRWKIQLCTDFVQQCGWEQALTLPKLSVPSLFSFFCLV